MNAADIMTPDAICAGPEMPVPELIRPMLDNHVSALPIVSASSAGAICCRHWPPTWRPRPSQQ